MWSDIETTFRVILGKIRGWETPAKNWQREGEISLPLKDNHAFVLQVWERETGEVLILSHRVWRPQQLSQVFHWLSPFRSHWTQVSVWSGSYSYRLNRPCLSSSGQFSGSELLTLHLDDMWQVFMVFLGTLRGRLPGGLLFCCLNVKLRTGSEHRDILSLMSEVSVWVSRRNNWFSFRISSV